MEIIPRRKTRMMIRLAACIRAGVLIWPARIQNWAMHRPESLTPMLELEDPLKVGDKARL
jgi:hypothetical protein